MEISDFGLDSPRRSRPGDDPVSCAVDDRQDSMAVAVRIACGDGKRIKGDPRIRDRMPPAAIGERSADGARGPPGEYP